MGKTAEKICDMIEAQNEWPAGGSRGCHGRGGRRMKRRFAWVMALALAVMLVVMTGAEAVKASGSSNSSSQTGTVHQDLGPVLTNGAGAAASDAAAPEVGSMETFTQLDAAEPSTGSLETYTQLDNTAEESAEVERSVWPAVVLVVVLGIAAMVVVPRVMKKRNAGK